MINLIIFLISIIAIILAVTDMFGDVKIPKQMKMPAILVCVIIAVLSAVITIIPTGYTGVRTTFGQVDDTTVQNGFNFQIPIIQKINRVNNKQQDKLFKDKIWGEAKDKTVVYAENVIVTYQIKPESSVYIYKNVSDYNKNLIPNTIVGSSVKTAMIQLSSDEVTNRAKIEKLTRDELEKAINDKYGNNIISVLKVTIDSMDFEDSYNQAIADKQIARQNAEKQAIENQKIIDMANAEQEKAKVEAETKRIQAEGDAQAEIISAKADAEAYKIKSEQITENLLRKWELDARLKHGWVTIQGANAIIKE